MKTIASALILTAAFAATPALAAGGDRHYAAYESCIADAAVRASYTQASTVEVVDLARAACASARTKALRERPDAVMAADAQRAEILPIAIETLRDRRRTRDAMYGLSQ